MNALFFLSSFLTVLKPTAATVLTFVGPGGELQEAW